MDLCDLAPGYVRAIAPYQPGKPISELAREMGLEESEIVKLASNENPLGPSPKVLEALRSALPRIARYPDGNGFELKSALARRYGVTLEQVVLGNGSNDLLEFAARAFLVPGSSAVYSQHAFAVYPLVTQAVGALGIEVAARDFGHDLSAMLDATTADSRVIFVANPNNPTGTLLSADALLDFLEQVPRTVLVVLDEAYTEYLDEGVRPDSISWLKRFPNLMITRTFSKAYGLAGLRVGFALAHPAVADMLNRVRQPFNVNSLAQTAALAALGDENYLKQGYLTNLNGMTQITDGFKRLGISYIPSYGNFVSFRIGSATAMYQKLLKQGVIVRPVANYGMPEYLRVSIGLETENAKFLQALQAALKEPQ
jgi:histidinol-phosphate aminotransferase